MNTDLFMLTLKRPTPLHGARRDGVGWGGRTGNYISGS